MRLMPAAGEKYELVDCPTADDAPPRFRIKALRDILPPGGDMVPAGMIGGYVDGYRNLAQEGECWVADEAMACERAAVLGDALMKDRATLVGSATLTGTALMADQAFASDSATISGGARVTGVSMVQGSALVSGTARVHDSQVTSGVLDGAGVRGMDKNAVYVFDASALASDRRRRGPISPCGAPTAQGGPCRHKVTPSAKRCPAGHLL